MTDTDLRPILVCVPFGGASEWFFLQWKRAIADRMDLMTVSLPGRDRRIDDPPLRDMAAAVTEALPQVLDRVGDGRTIVLFGHSMGAVLAYELAVRLVAHGGVRLRGLVVSGSADPGTTRPVRLTGLDDDAFLDGLARLTGHREAAMEDSELRELVLPTLRADVEMHENYRPSARVRLPVPIVAMRGDGDELVPAEQARRWAERTDRDFQLDTVPGGHMFVLDHPEPVLRAAWRLMC